MSCCGKQNQRFNGAISLIQPVNPAREQQTNGYRDRQSVAYFEYLGKAGSTITGPQTGKQYRFDRPGMVVSVDLRDRPGLKSIPLLRERYSL